MKASVLEIPKIWKVKTFKIFSLGWWQVLHFQVWSTTDQLLANIKKAYTGYILYLDEPTTGLHFEDIRFDGSD
jgi:hypothetical protein